MAIRHKTTAPRSSLWDNDHVGDLDDLDDVSAPAPSADQALVWNGAAWAPADQAAGDPDTNVRVVMRVGIANPPEPVLNIDGSDWVYGVLA